MSRNIFCTGCNKYLGEIRDASLRKEISHLCKQCETKRKAADMHMKTKSGGQQSGSDFLKGIFGV